uniref:Uncharacterized protein n=1 Tax=Zea mays TaxID=4577 RepID=A0A804PR83_MAIZE
MAAGGARLGRKAEGAEQLEEGARCHEEGALGGLEAPAPCCSRSPGGAGRAPLTSAGRGARSREPAATTAGMWSRGRARSGGGQGAPALRELGDQGRLLATLELLRWLLLPWEDSCAR